MEKKHPRVTGSQRGTPTPKWRGRALRFFLMKKVHPDISVYAAVKMLKREKAREAKALKEEKKRDPRKEVGPGEWADLPGDSTLYDTLPDLLKQLDGTLKQPAKK
jgi:hypothetical protein